MTKPYSFFVNTLGNYDFHLAGQIIDVMMPYRNKGCASTGWIMGQVGMSNGVVKVLHLLCAERVMERNEEGVCQGWHFTDKFKKFVKAQMFPSVFSSKNRNTGLMKLIRFLAPEVLTKLVQCQPIEAHADKHNAPLIWKERKLLVGAFGYLRWNECRFEDPNEESLMVIDKV